MDPKDVYILSDQGLVEAIGRLELQVPNALLGPWERSFATGVKQAFIDFGCITWKQRKVVREILIRFIEMSDRRSSLEKAVKRRVKRTNEMKT